MIRRRFLGVYLALLSSALPTTAPALASSATQFEAPLSPIAFDIDSLDTALNLPVSDKVETLKMPLDVMRDRLSKAQADETVEPITITTGPKEAQVAALVQKLAATGKAAALTDYLRRQLQVSPITRAASGAVAKTVTLDEAGFNLVNSDALADLYAKAHHNLTIDGQTLKRDRHLRRELLREIVPFFSKKERDHLQAKINRGEDLDVNTDLLPDFARKMLKHYIIYRGPNCFHAALAFQSPVLTSSSLVNVKQEPGYHRAMINYDELWRVLKAEFYEVDPHTQPLKYGDLMVLIDVPENAVDQDPGKTALDFRWIRHTATYLFDGYAFSKGSKSPNTPYTVRTVEEEWSTWKRLTTNLGLKVFRRSLTNVSARPPLDLRDWVY